MNDPFVAVQLHFLGDANAHAGCGLLYSLDKPRSHCLVVVSANAVINATRHCAAAYSLLLSPRGMESKKDAGDIEMSWHQ